MFDESDIVFSYTTDQAIEDGVLVHPFPEKFPYLLLSASVHAAIELMSREQFRSCKMLS